MADFFTTFNSATAQTLVGSETGFVTRNGGLFVDGADAITATTGTNWLTVEGYVFAYDGGFAAVDVDGSVFEMVVTEAGYVSAENNTQGVIDVDVSTKFDLFNHGIIHSPNDRAIEFNATDDNADFLLSNSGTISARSGEAIYVAPVNGDFILNNSGEIYSTGETIQLNRGGSDIANTVITNSGSIVSSLDDALYIDHGASDLYFENSGEIIGYNAAFESNDNGDVEASNSGLLKTTKANGDAFETEGGNDLLVNTGEIIGNVDLGQGNDTIDTRDGIVHGTLYGGDGNDEYWISSPDALIYDLSGTDHVFIASSYELSSRLEDLTLLGGDRIDGTGNASNNEITGNVNRNELLGLDGSDTLSGLGGNDRLDGGSDADSLTGGSGSDYILGGEGSDNDTLNGNSGNDTLLGEGGNDSLFGGDQHDRLLGGEGNDTLVGGSGDDVMLGGSGFDHFYGEAGNDTLTGDFNADTFFFADGFGDDIVTDFDANNDNERIDLHSVTNIVDFADLMANHAAQSGNRVVISDGSDSITLLGVQLADLDAIDFIF